MHINKITSQHRRDFWAIYQCEHCDYKTSEQSGYDDTNFHKNVIPAMECPACGKVADENYRPLETKYPDSKTV